ncbi:response regulator transcription factor [Halarcobacter anaerophilus]|jgi:DNA-binding response OmpR family regulator|uniref:response regulator transcription factor n=1 Tax=Halarcobacter anaerophilus TaxID=877500 RepID=UPI000A49DF35|nr:response regulator transcription factor [Halarcobacter anaerophilus]
MIKNRVLLIEDDEDVIVWIKEYLEEFGFEVSALTTVTDAISNISVNSYNIILLDINLPDFYGYEVLKHIQSNKNDIPVIVISAYSDRKTKLHAFKLGASDYMTKPIDLEELEARIRVHTKSNSPDFQNKLFFVRDNTIFFQDKALSLTKTEFELLSKLIENKNILLERKFLCEALSSISSNRSLDYHIRNIRKKIGDEGSNPKYLLTEYGLGYKLIY